MKRVLRHEFINADISIQENITDIFKFIAQDPNSEADLKRIALSGDQGAEKVIEEIERVFSL